MTSIIGPVPQPASWLSSRLTLSPAGRLDIRLASQLSLAGGPTIWLAGQLAGQLASWLAKYLVSQPDIWLAD